MHEWKEEHLFRGCFELLRAPAVIAVMRVLERHGARGRALLAAAGVEYVMGLPCVLETAADCAGHFRGMTCAL